MVAGRKETAEEGTLSATARLKLGLTLIAIGLLMPFGALLVPLTNWPPEVQIPVGGFLFFGFEIMALPAAAVMGKENFDRIVTEFCGLLGRLKPSGQPGELRHAIGVILFVAPIAPTYVMAYAPSWLPDASPWRLWVNLGADAMFLTSLFVLGGDFWDKLRALFVREARAVFPHEGGESAPVQR
jgi:hypothetical protein